MTITQQLIPTGTWSIDGTHSTAIFEVAHAAVGTFRGQFRRIEGGIADGVLRGEVWLETIDVFDENLKRHLLSPDFFDAERNPKLTFVATDVRGDAGDVVVGGDLTLRGVTRRVQAAGTVRGPLDLGEHGGTKLGIDLRATIDRTEFGLAWNAPLSGGNRMLGDEVTLSVHLQLVPADA